MHVEIKLWRDPEVKRDVLAQALDGNERGTSMK